MAESLDSGVPRCAVVIPSYDGAMLTRSCLEALLASPPLRCEWQLVVVDDGSSDDTAAVLASYGDAITVVSHERNMGFATACNSGAEACAPCDFLMFLNNDTLPIAGWLDALVDQLESKSRAAIVGAKLLFPNGTVQHAGVAIAQNGWPRHLYAGFPGEHPAVDRTRRVAAVTGACLLVRSTIFAELGGFDPAFHNGYEDVDLCHRATHAGHEVWYCGQSVVYHLESVTRWPAGVPDVNQANMHLYAERWGGLAADDFDYYLQDGLLSAEYGPYDPFELTVSPDLAIVRQGAQEFASLERLVSRRASQVMELLSGETREALRSSLAGRPAAFPARRSERSSAVVIAEGRTHQLGPATGGPLVSLLMPVKNQEQDVRELVPLVLTQAVTARLEIVAVDSGSKDKTVEVLREHGATVIAIDPSEFDHGLTRNLAAEHANGDFLLFVSGRGRPAGPHWLRPLLGALEADPQAAGACSRVLPGSNADVLTAKDGASELSGSDVRQRKLISDWESYRRLSVEARREMLNFHTVSAALRAGVFRRIPFRSVVTLGEDLLWAREVVEAGWALWHEPASIAYHSHAYTLRELFARNVDDGLANREINERSLAEADLQGMIKARVVDDWRYLRELSDLDEHELESLKIEAVLRRTAQAVGQWVGVNHEEMPPGLVPFFSGVQQARMSG